MQRDPLGYAPGWNLYQYVNGMPWGSVDPMGLFGWGDAWRIYKDVMTSYVHSYAIIADAVTFESIDSLHQYVEDITEQNGETYHYAKEAAEVARDALLLASGGGLLNAGKKFLQKNLGAAGGLMLRIQVARGLTPAATEAPGARAFQAWIGGNTIALGTGVAAGGAATGSLIAGWRSTPSCDAPTNPVVNRVLRKLDLYPRVIDPRTGRHIPFPSDIGGAVPQTQRVPWGAKERGEFIHEWYRRGYETPRGGWENYDIHHVKPREFGGGNGFWNLVPVERQTHQELFNTFWREFTGL